MSTLIDTTQRITNLSFRFYEGASFAQLLAKFEKSAEILRNTPENTSERSIKKFDTDLRKAFSRNIERILHSEISDKPDKEDHFYLFKDILDVANDIKVCTRAAKKIGYAITLSCFQDLYADVLRGLGKNGFTAIALKIGDKFDPKYHNAIAQNHKIRSLSPNTVVEITKDGFIYNDKLLVQAADVIVSPNEA